MHSILKTESSMTEIMNMKEREWNFVNDHIRNLIVIDQKGSLHQRDYVWLKYSVDGMA